MSAKATSTANRPRLGSRGINRSAVLRQVLHSRRASRSQIAKSLGLTLGAVSRITQELISVGLLEAVGSHAPAGKPGRRFVELAMAADGGYVLGVALEASVQHASIVDLTGRLVLRKRLHFPRIGDAHASVGWLGAELDRIVKLSRIDRSRFFGVGVAPVGVVDPYSGIVIDSPLRGWRHVEIAQPLGAALTLPVRVDSMLNALSLAEHVFGLSRERRNVIFVHTTLGIGASLLADGRIVRGGGMQAGQIAHVKVTGSSLTCICGQRGCLNTVASGHAVLARMGFEAPADSDLETRLTALTAVLERANLNDADAVTAVLHAGRALGRFLGAIVSFAGPEAVLLGGRLGENPNYLWGVREGLRDYQAAGRPVEVLSTSMGGDMAAALMAIEDLVCARPLDISPLQAKLSARTAQRRKRSSLSPRGAATSAI